MTDVEEIHCFEWEVDPPEIEGASRQCEGVCFLAIDLASVAAIRTFVEELTAKFNFIERVAFEVALISDELIANAVVATSQRECGFESIMYRWTVLDNQVYIRVIDYGGGLDIERVREDLPVAGSFEEFSSDLKEYRENSIARVKNKGMYVDITRFGRGLRIVEGLVTSFELQYHKRSGDVVDQYDNDVQGTIVSITYDRK